jgi:hypothetical protein
MSTTLYALVILQGTSLSFSPGYATAAECLQQYKGPFVSCFAYDPDSTTWTAFFKLPAGGFRTVGRISGEDECKRYIGAFKDDVSAACRQLALPTTCSAACRLPETPPPVTPPPVKPEAPEPDSNQPPAAQWHERDNVQLARGHYGPGFVWIPGELPKETVTGLDKPKRVARRTRQQPQFDPFSALVSLFTPMDY